MATAKKRSDETRIEFEYDGNKYCLEFDRASALETEKRYEVSLLDVQNVRMTAFSGMFHGAFIKNHPDVPQDKIDEIMDKLPRKMELFKSLSIMYGNCLAWLFEEPDEGNAISWTAR